MPNHRTAAQNGVIGTLAVQPGQQVYEGQVLARLMLVAGGAQNFKVTYPEDFALASAVLAYREGSSTTARFGELAPAKPERGNRFF